MLRRRTGLVLPGLLRKTRKNARKAAFCPNFASREKSTHRPPKLIKFPMPAARHAGMNTREIPPSPFFWCWAFFFKREKGGFVWESVYYRGGAAEKGYAIGEIFYIQKRTERAHFVCSGQLEPTWRGQVAGGALIFTHTGGYGFYGFESRCARAIFFVGFWSVQDATKIPWRFWDSGIFL